jgi:hypothetical protein
MLSTAAVVADDVMNEWALASLITVTLGVTNVGEVLNTARLVPVSSVMAEARLADDGVARKVPTPVPSPETPVEIGRPVAFVKVPEVGTPSTGVTKVGEVLNTATPVPDSSLKTPANCAEVVAAN